VLVVRPSAGQQVVAATCARSRRAGVRPGLTLAHARALLSGCRVSIADEDTRADAACLLALARWASRRWSPVVQVDPPDGLLMDTGGCDHLFGGEDALIGVVEHTVRGLGLTPRGAIASTVGTAWGAARFGEERVVARGDERGALSAFPTGALRIESDAIEALAEVGVERIGQILDLPRHTLPSRYGPEVLRRIDQALGHLPEPVERTGEGVSVHAARELPGGTTNLESVETTVRGLLGEVSAMLAGHESGLRRIDATFDRLDGEPERLVVQVTSATRDARHLWALLRPKVERVDMGFGVERIALQALGIVRLTHRQGDLLDNERPRGEGRDDEQFAALIDTLASRLGHENVVGATLVASHRPENAFRFAPLDELQPACEPRGLQEPDGERFRPARLLERPSPVETMALTPDGPVLRLRWRGVEHRILCTVGPERLGPEWWKLREPTRDYFRVQDEHGRWLWVFRETCSRRWFVHGEWC
jgi:protein ImuB